MQKQDFQEHHRYTVALRDENGKVRPVNFYVYKLFADDMIIRRTDKEGMIYKVKYDDVLKIVKTQAVEKNNFYTLPAAVLDAKTWKSRNSMQAYSSSPHLGK